MPRLGKRLLLIAENIPAGSRVADVGTDHAVLPIHLVKTGITDRVIASDIAKKPLEKAAENVKRAGLSGVIELRLSDGLKGVSPDEVDTVVIAGMGGELIADILEAAPWLRNKQYRLILQPMTKAEKLRRYLREQQYEFLGEQAVYDAGRYFTVMVLHTLPCKAEYPPFFDYTGLLCDSKTDEGTAYLEHTAKLLSQRAQDMLEQLRDSAEYIELTAAKKHIDKLIK